MVRVKIPNLLSSSIAPSDEGLLDWVREHSTSPILKQIAANDYGEEVPDHLAAIQRQLSSNPLTGLLPWCPREVLELERWNEPPVLEGDNVVRVQIEHTRRLLACTLLLWSATTVRVSKLTRLREEIFFLDTSAATTLRLTASASALGQEVASRTLDFLLWLYQRIEYEPLLPFISVCVLLLWIDTKSPRSNSGIQEIVDWTIEQELRVRLSTAERVESERWLLGLNSYEVNRASDWVSVADRMLGKHGQNTEDFDGVKDIVNRLRKE